MSEDGVEKRGERERNRERERSRGKERRGKVGEK